MEKVEIGARSKAKSGIFVAAYRETLPKVFHSPVTWLLTVLWLLAASYMILVGHGSFVVSILPTVAFSLVMMLLTIPLTAGGPKPAWEMPPGYSRTRLWLQIGVIVLIVLVIQYFDLVVNGTIDANRVNIPLLGPLFGAVYTAAKVHNGGPVFLASVAMYVIVPVVLMLLLGARWRELGFGKGYHSWRTFALWSFLFLVLIAVALILRRVTPAALLGGFVVLLLLAGLTEEVFYRGVVMTRLTQLTGSVAWGIGLSALLFGLGHLGTTLPQEGGNVPLALAHVVVNYVFTGIPAAVIFLRTRSLLTGVLYHTLGDVVSFYIASALSIPFL